MQLALKTSAAFLFDFFGFDFLVPFPEFLELELEFGVEGGKFVLDSTLSLSQLTFYVRLVLNKNYKFMAWILNAISPSHASSKHFIKHS